MTACTARARVVRVVFGTYALLLSLVCASCLGPAGSDRAGYSANLYDEHARLPKLDADKLLATKVDANDGLDGMLVPLRTGFAVGKPVAYWDLGTTGTTLKAGWVFRRRHKDGTLEDFGHPNLIDSIPGDTAYSAVRLVYLVLVTTRYDGERITSPQALEDAVELGLVDEPQNTNTYADWPVVAASQRLDRGPDQEPLTPSTIYYRGTIATYFPFGMTAQGMGAHAVPMSPMMIAVGNEYVLKRQNESRVLDEVVWKADLDGDGDSTDSNNIFATAEPTDSPFRHEVDVTVAPDYVFGSFSADSDLFQKQMMAPSTPIDGAVLQYTDNTMTWLNRPLLAAEPAVEAPP